MLKHKQYRRKGKLIMCSQETIDGIDSGELIPVKKWKYYISFWAPMIAILTMVSVGSMWFSELKGTTFDNPSQKTLLVGLGERALERESMLNIWLEKTEEHIRDEDKYATKVELAELREDLKDVKIDIRWIRNYLTNKK